MTLTCESQCNARSNSRSPLGQKSHLKAAQAAVLACSRRGNKLPQSLALTNISVFHLNWLHFPKSPFWLTSLFL
jgi:hypothetical protein